MKTTRRYGLLKLAGLIAVAMGFPMADSGAEMPKPAPGAPAAQIHAGELERSFARPPASARPWVYWFWVNGNITREGITADLEAMQRAGIGGVLIMDVALGTPEGPVKFGGPEWRELFQFVLAEAARLGLEVKMNNDAGWEGSGGPWIKPEQSMQKIVWTETAVEGPKQFSGKLTQPETIAGTYRDITLLAFPTPGPFRIADVKIKALDIANGMHFYFHDYSPAFTPGGANIPAESVVDRRQIINLSDKMDKDGHLVWAVPQGRWTVMRIGHTSTGANNAPAPASGRGLECDKLDAAALDVHFDALMAKLIRDAGPAAGKGGTLVATHIDSWEAGMQNWTPRMREEFTKRRGYDPLPWLPVISGRVVENLDVSERFLWDLRQTISDLLVENYAGHLRDLAHRNGLRLSIEPYNAPCNDLTYAGQADEPMGEFWMTGFMSQTCKGISSASHVYGKPITGAESFTAGEGERWLAHPATMKVRGDRAFCEGINRFVIHRYAMQPWLNCQPGMTLGPFGVHYERTQTWWDNVQPWHEYLARCQYLLQQGLFVADICALQAEDSPQHFPRPYSRDRYGIGYDFDHCSPEVVLTRMSVRDGRLALPDGMSYRIMVLPENDRMTPALLGKIRDLVEAGATVVGPRPVRSPSLAGYPNCDVMVKRLADELWGDCDGGAVKEHRLGKGKVVCGRTPAEVLAAMDVRPDFSTAGNVSAFVNRIHRVVGDMDAYFVANSSPHPIETACGFRVKNKRPELWHPESGRMEPVAVYDEKDGVTRLPLRLDPGGSVFVVFRPGSVPDSNRVVQLARNGTPVFDALAPIQPNLAIGAKASASSTDPGRGYPAYSELKINDGDSSTALGPATSWVNDVSMKLPQWAALDFGAMKTVGAVEVYTTDGYALKEFQVQCWDGRKWSDVGDRIMDNTDVHRTIAFSPTMASKLRVMCYRGPDNQPALARLNEIEVYETVGTPVGIAPAATVAMGGDRLDVQVCQPGKYDMKTADGKTCRFEVAALPEPQEITGPWQLRFPPQRDAPENVTLEKLISWSQHVDPGVRHFSGTATYTKTFDVPMSLIAKDKRLYLDLGNVAVMADVTLNGKNLGILWKPPFRVEITDAVKPGDNDLEIKVVNLWVNRMIGDEQLPEDSDRILPGAGKPGFDGTLKQWPPWLQAGKPSPAGRFTFTTWRLWKKGDPLQESGLLGPVTLQSGRQIQTRQPGHIPKGVK